MMIQHNYRSKQQFGKKNSESIHIFEVKESDMFEKIDQVRKFEGTGDYKDNGEIPGSPLYNSWEVGKHYIETYKVLHVTCPLCHEEVEVRSEFVGKVGD